MIKPIIKSERQLIITFVIASIFIGVASFYFLSKSVYEYNLTEKIKSPTFQDDGPIFIYYNDLDNDGKSESIIGGYSKPEKNYYLLVASYKGNKKEQFNFGDVKSKRQFMSFYDYDNDNIKEIFIVTQQKDSLFLNIISVKNLKFILKNRLIYVRPNIRRNEQWYIYFIFQNLADFNGDGSKDLLMSFATGFALHPRGFMIYDIKNDKIIKWRPLKSSFLYNYTYVEDIDDNGKVEIVSSSRAGGNYKILAGLHDYTSWFIVLDNNLNFKYPPLNFGGFATKTYNAIIENNNEKQVVLVVFDPSDSSESKFLLLSQNMKILKEKIIQNKHAGWFSLFKSDNKLYIVDTFNNNFIKIYNQNFTLLDSSKNSNPQTGVVMNKDFNLDGRDELVFVGNDELLITDLRLNILAKTIINPAIYDYSFIRNGKDKAPYLSIQYADKNVAYALESSFIFKYLFPIVFAICVIVFLLLWGTHKFISKVMMLFTTFMIFINKNDSALLFLKPNGKIIAFNKRFYKIAPSEKLKKGCHYTDLLKDKKTIKSAIDYSFKDNIETKKDLSFYEDGKPFKGNIHIIPFKSFLGFTYAYFVKIVDYTKEIINDRINIWTHTAQKIAHELKTPIGSLNLNLSALKKRMNEDKLNNSKEVIDDINTMEGEIKRLKNLTSSFLKITNLEKINIQSYQLCEVLINSLQKFESYFKGNVELKIDETINDKTIFADKNQIVELIQIIIENAIDAIEGKGKIEICARPSSNNFIELIIKDFGKGIPSNNIDNLFDPYFTTKREGTGLGLAFAKKIIEDNNGKIKIESTIGKGTTVILLIPSTPKLKE